MTDRPGILIDAELARLQAKLDGQAGLIDSLTQKYADQFRDSQAMFKQLEILGLADRLLDARIAALEPKPPEPVPTPAFQPWLKVQDGAFYDRGKLFRNCGANLVGEAAMTNDWSVFQGIMDRIEAAGVRFLRGLHIAVDDKVKPSQYQPLYSEARAGFKYWDRLVDETKKREMFCCITLHHRQRLTLEEATALGVADTLFSPQPQAGEVGASFLVIPAMEKLVTDWCVEMASRYKDEPHVVFIIANEKPRYPGYHYLDRTKVSDVNKTYRTEWFKRFDPWQKSKGLTDNETRAHHYAEFQAWNAVNVYRRMYAALRSAGITQLIATTNGLGNCRMDVLPILAAGDFVSWHTYGFVPDLPNPFEMNSVRDLWSIQKAIRVKGKPVVLDEHANVNEGAETMFPDYATGPFQSAHASFDVNCHYAAFQGLPGSTAAKVYTGFNVEGFEQALKDANTWQAGNTKTNSIWHQLTESELFGERVKQLDGVWKEFAPPIVGVGTYNADGVELPDSVKAW